MSNTLMRSAISAYGRSSQRRNLSHPVPCSPFPVPCSLVDTPIVSRLPTPHSLSYI
ncbi:hypothetical protein [Moorena producens]|uniref:hypothetical protein n=1 Tax=Moorena producens TaxID=1155739 RepID=UPI0013147D7A|nr:hypothetical protein [Moorena producens]